MNDDWLHLQQKYWEQWSDVSRKALGLDTGGTDAWESAMDHWWQAMAPAAPDPSRDFMERMLEQGKMFFRMADNFTRSLQSTQKDPADGWQAINGVLAEIQKAFSGNYQEGDDALHKMLAFWELPYDNWQRTMSSLSPIPGDLLRNMPHDQVKESLHRFLSAPGLGYAREEQSQSGALLLLGAEEGLEDPLGGICRNSGSVVGHQDAYSTGFLIEGRRQAQNPLGLAFHGVQGVSDQVDQDLGELQLADVQGRKVLRDGLAQVDAAFLDAAREQAQ